MFILGVSFGWIKKATEVEQPSWANVKNIQSCKQFVDKIYSFFQTLLVPKAVVWNSPCIPAFDTLRQQTIGSRLIHTAIDQHMTNKFSQINFCITMILTLEVGDGFYKEYLLTKESLHDSNYCKWPTACNTHSKPKSVLDFPGHNSLALLTHPIPKP